MPVAVALGMLDKGRQVLKAKTEVDVQFVGREQLPEIEKHHRILSKDTIKQANESWQITGAEARDWGIVKVLAEDRDDVIRQMQAFARHRLGRSVPRRAVPGEEHRVARSDY